MLLLLLLLVFADTYTARWLVDRWAAIGDCCRLLSLTLWGVLVPSRGRPRKATLVDCAWLVWSSSCVGCVAPSYGFGRWCQLAREPPSEWIATTRISLVVSKWTSVKNHCVIIWFRGDWSSLVFIFVIDSLHRWLAHSSTRLYNTPSFPCIYFS
jgi:hypothetical protein